MLDATQLDALKALVSNYRGQADDIEAAITLHETGYQSDKDYIAAQIRAGADALADEHAALIKQRDDALTANKDLQEKLDAANATTAKLQAAAAESVPALEAAAAGPAAE